MKENYPEGIVLCFLFGPILTMEAVSNWHLVASVWIIMRVASCFSLVYFLASAQVTL